MKPKDRFLNYFKKTIDKEDLIYEGSIEDFDYYKILYLCGEKDNLHNFGGNNLCMVNYRYEENPAVLILFSIPINISEDDDNKIRTKKQNDVIHKDINERVMENIIFVEKCLTTLDYISVLEKMEEKFTFLLIMKILENEE